MESAHWITLNQSSLISALACRGLWEAATAHGSGGSVSSAKPARFITETRASGGGHKVYRGNESCGLYLSLKKDFLAFPEAHLTNGGGDSQDASSLS